MENAGYAALNRQVGLLREMSSVANNIANMSTTGFRREGVVFSEFVRDLGPDGESLSMASARARAPDLSQGTLAATGGTFDLAIDGEGFFLIATPEGEQLTRAGNFTRDGVGTVVTADGFPLLDGGGAPVFVPPNASNIAIAPDGTLSVDSIALAQIGLWMPADPTELSHENGTRFSIEGGTVPVDNSVVRQGFLEGSNVNPVNEITRMIEVQRAYELGQNLMDRDDERIRSVLRTLGS